MTSPGKKKIKANQTMKNLNDTKGHLFGNKALVDLADVIRNTTRKDDIAGRYGGEKFMIIFPDSKLKDATDITERIRRAAGTGFQYP